MKPLYVRTDDFRLAHRLLSEFTRRNLPVKQLSLSQPVEQGAYWFGTPEEVALLGGRGVAVEVDSVSSTISTWLLSRQLEAPPKQLVVGVDPGPRPGFAFLADGVVLGKREMEAIDDAIDATVQLVNHVKPMEVLVRVGHGSPVHRDRLVNRMLSMGYHVEIVNEHRTSSGQSRHAHGSAAIKIATKHRAFGFVPAGANAIHKAAARIVVERCDFYRRVDGKSLRHECHTSAKLDRAGRA